MVAVGSDVSGDLKLVQEERVKRQVRMRRVVRWRIFSQDMGKGGSDDGGGQRFIF